MRPASLPRAAAALTLAAAAAGCSDATAPDRTAPFSALINGRPFAASASASRVRGSAGRDTLYVHSGSAGGVGEYEVGVSFTLASFTGPGRYRLGPYHAYVHETVGGDAGHSSYVTAAPEAGTVVVTEYDAAGGTVAGHLEFVAPRDRAYTAGSFGSSVSVTDGQFRAAVRTFP